MRSCRDQSHLPQAGKPSLSSIEGMQQRSATVVHARGLRCACIPTRRTKMECARGPTEKIFHANYDAGRLRRQGVVAESLSRKTSTPRLHNPQSCLALYSPSPESECQRSRPRRSDEALPADSGSLFRALDHVYCSILLVTIVG